MIIQLHLRKHPTYVYYKNKVHLMLFFPLLGLLCLCQHLVCVYVFLYYCLKIAAS